MASVPRPKNTTILVLGVIESARPAVGIADGTAGSDERDAREFTTTLRLAAKSLAAPGRMIETLTQLGHPADAIVEEAARPAASCLPFGPRRHVLRPFARDRVRQILQSEAETDERNGTWLGAIGG